MNNRNPYHNYGDLQGIMNKIIEVNDMWNSKDYELLASGHKKSNFYLPNYKKSIKVEKKKKIFLIK